MGERVAPIFRVSDGHAATDWYRRLGFEVVQEHRFTPELPLYVILSRAGVQLHLSEHEGDAPAGSLAYLWIDDLDRVAEEFGVAVRNQPWGREIEIIDPDGNRLRIAAL
jgi:catechol 2,3-dioxygenase-like lactoylglutathione lyase family enzyme